MNRRTFFKLLGVAPIIPPVKLKKKKIPDIKEIPYIKEIPLLALLEKIKRKKVFFEWYEDKFIPSIRNSKKIILKRMTR